MRRRWVMKGRVWRMPRGSFGVASAIWPEIDEAAMAAHVQDGGVEHLAADIVEINVVALRGCGAERAPQGRRRCGD
jgi:hypothetical protein